ncbi:MAG: ATP synthase F1 subunit delta [Pirellulaceae bacterium]|nr:ATP synthase F1 subunit delta [Pirellulaceae bacterium]
MSEVTAIETVFDDESMHVGQVYAKALLAAAHSEGKADLIVEQLSSLVNDVLAKQPALVAIFANPKLAVEEKAGILDRIFGKSIDPILLKTIKVIALRRRFGMIGSIQQAAVRMQDEAQGRLQVIVTTAQALDASALDNLRDKLKTMLKAEVSISNKVDPSVIGGLMVRVGDTVFDGSVDGQLKQMKKATLAKAEQAIREKLSQLSS